MIFQSFGMHVHVFKIIRTIGLYQVLSFFSLDKSMNRLELVAAACHDQNQLAPYLNCSRTLAKTALLCIAWRTSWHVSSKAHTALKRACRRLENAISKQLGFIVVEVLRGRGKKTPH